MFLVLILRDGPIHIVNYQMSNGNYKTFCNQNIDKRLRLNTLEVDNTFPGICDSCKKDADDMYQFDLDYDTVTARKRRVFSYENALELHKFDLLGPKVKFEELMEHRWFKLNKYKKLLNRNKKK